jgi:hypothetical protein
MIRRITVSGKRNRDHSEKETIIVTFNAGPGKFRQAKSISVELLLIPADGDPLWSRGRRGHAIEAQRGSVAAHAAMQKAMWASRSTPSSCAP